MVDHNGLISIVTSNHQRILKADIYILDRTGIVGIPEELLDALNDVLKEMTDDDTAVAFSGGLDSGVIAAIASRHGKIKLYTVGTEGSYDVEASRELAEMMGLEWQHILLTDDELESNLKEMISITGTVNPITLSFEIPIYYVMKYIPESNILSGQGADEIFAGYAKYENMEHDELRDRMNHDMLTLMRTTEEHENKVARNFNKTLRYPYLSDDVLKIVEKADIADLAPKDVRKAFLRDVAILLNEPEIAAKPKKAAQYGSGTMESLRRIAKRKGMTVNGLIGSLSDGM